MNKYIFIFGILFLNWQCKGQSKEQKSSSNRDSTASEMVNFLDYRGTPGSEFDKDLLMFSDQGAWFAYSMPTEPKQGGFSGPFLMTQDNGIWSSPALVEVHFLDKEKDTIHPQGNERNYKSDLSGLKYSFSNDRFKIENNLFYASSNTAAIRRRITNLSKEEQTIYPVIEGDLKPSSLSFNITEDGIFVETTINNSSGYIKMPEELEMVQKEDKRFKMTGGPVLLQPGEIYETVHTQTFLFSEEELKNEQEVLQEVQEDFDGLFNKRKLEKSRIIEDIQQKIESPWQDNVYRFLANKLLLTLQNNWRSAAGSLKHSGLFPSYHYKWFQGFWAWDSWKQAAALAQYNPSLAKDQMFAMYDYQTETGFVPDVIYRDNLIEENNYRDTKPPLSAWAAWSIYEEDKDPGFLKEIYPKIKEQHNWWYEFRDHDQDGLCEYGSTDGSLVAAKWESGMDNAVRFDSSSLVKNSENAYSLNQESVDLNSYLYAEKQYLAKMAEVLNKERDKVLFDKEAADLKEKVRTQFYDNETGWFYDTSMDGKEFIEVMGSEGWIPLWAEIATREQAEEVKDNILNPEYFNTPVPLQTLTAASKEFEPDGGYWRGPNWIDQTYFGIQGLKKYGYVEEANMLMKKVLHNAEGVLEPGKSIRENYNPITGEGLEAKNFSWSAAHLLLLLLNE